MSIYQWCTTKLEYIEIKFNDTISTSTLVNANFALFNVTTSTAITNPFLPINVARDYYSISRTLRIWFNFSLAADTSYRLTMSGLKTVGLGSVLPTDTYEFETHELPIVVEENLPPTREPVDVEDYTIKDTDFDLVVSAVEDVSDFHVVVSNPSLDTSYYLTSSAAEGRIDLQFNQSPAANYVTSDYFKVQRKLVSRSLSRWEPVSALVTADTVNNYIYIYLPSNDTTPVYGEPDKVYWEPGYKYRLKVLSGIGV